MKEDGVPETWTSERTGLVREGSQEYRTGVDDGSPGSSSQGRSQFGVAGGRNWWEEVGL